MSWGRLWLLLLGGIILRVSMFFSYEFKLDQWNAVQAGMEGQAVWSIMHGMNCSNGLPNPPGFYQFMTMAGLFGKSLDYFAMVFILCSMAGVACLFWLKKDLKDGEMYCAVGATAFSPMLVMGAANIWAQWLLIPLSTLIFGSLVRFRKSGCWAWWCLTSSLTLFAGSIHIAGLFLFPAVMFLGFLQWRWRLWKYALIPGAVGVLLFGPYLVWLCGNYDFGNMATCNSWKYAFMTFVKSMGCFLCGGYGFHVFDTEYPAVLAGADEVWPWMILSLAWGINALGVLWGAWCFWKNRLSRNEPVFVAVVLCLGMIFLFPLFRIVCSYYYFNILWTPLAVLCAHGMVSLTVPSLRRGVCVLYLIASVWLTVSAMMFIRNANGHYWDYGVPYHTWGDLRERFLAEYPADSRLVVCGKDAKARQKMDPEILEHVFGELSTREGQKVCLWVETTNTRPTRYQFRFVAEQTEK